MSAWQTRWGYAWALDERAGRVDLYVRDLAVLNTLADGDMGADLPDFLRERLPPVRAAATARLKRLAGAVPAEFLTTPHLMIMRAGSLEHFEVLDEWDALLARLARKVA